MHLTIDTMAAVLGCILMLALAAVTLYTAHIVSRLRRELPGVEVRQQAELRRAVADARDAAARARADVDGLRVEIDDALCEVAGRLAAGGMDVTTGLDDDNEPTDPRIELRSGVVLAFPRRIQ